MSRAYCLTCNDQVEQTAGGTCPLGHPVATPDHGPEPWVGFAGTDRAVVATDELEQDHEVPMARIDTLGRPVAHAAVNGHNGHASHNGHNGHEVPTNGHALGGGHGAADPFPATFGHRSSFQADEDTAPTERAPADSQAADDLAALLADALGDQAPSTATPEPAEAAPDPDDVLEQLERDFVDQFDEPLESPPAPGDDWDDLASLAAELQLDADQGTDDMDVDALLAELSGDDDPDEPTEASEAAEASVEPVPVSDSIPPLDDVGSTPPPVADAPTPWDDDDLADLDTPDATPAPPVDLTNFTARGRRVGGAGSSSSRTSRLPFGRKKG